MSDGITDATKADKKIIEAWKKDEMRKFLAHPLSYIPTKELVEELSRREFVETYTARLARIIIVVIK